MITAFVHLQSVNANGTKSISVRAVEDASGGMENFTFEIIDQTVTVKQNFASNASQTVTANHTASGKGLVTVTVANSQQSIQKMLDLDKPSDP